MLFTRLNLLNFQVIPVSTTAQPLSVDPASPSVVSSGVKPGTALVSFCFEYSQIFKTQMCVLT